MRCRKHQADVSSTIGVCASCLRERLIPLVLAIQSPPLIFPRSVSPPPRVPLHNPPLFFTTPQSHIKKNTNNTNNKPSTKFSLLPKFLRSNSTSSTWISTFFSKKSSSTATTTTEIPFRRRGRGMSPARVSDCGGDDEFESERGTPARRRRNGGGGGSQNVAAFCLSPLVRPCPKRRWDQKPASGEQGMMTMPPQSLGAAAGFCANRSRKMADFGRLHRRP